MVSEIDLINSINKITLRIAIMGVRFLTVDFILILTKCLKDEFVAQKRPICYSSK